MSSVINQTKCILLHSYIPGKEQLIKSINCNYFEHTGFPCTEWIDTFFNDNIGSLSNLTHFAFMYDNNGRHMSLFSNDSEYFGELFTYFLNKLVALNSGIIIDIITCNINTDQQKARIATLETQFNIDIRYSLNETGNYNKGGDWLMESDNVNIKDTYFNTNINDWHHVLAFNVKFDYPEHVFDVSGKRIIFWTDICGNEVNPTFDASDNLLTVPTGRTLLNRATINITDKLHGILETSTSSTWDNQLKMMTPNNGVTLRANGTCNPATMNYNNENSVTSVVQLNNVKCVWGSQVGGGAALKNDGSCVIWGATTAMCTLQLFPSNLYVSVSAQLQSGVVCVAFTFDGGAAALKSNGSVVTWGARDYGGSMFYPIDVSAQLQRDVIMVVANSNGNTNQGAFAALKRNGGVVTWGFSSSGGSFNSSSISSQLQSNVKMIYPAKDGFVALKNDGMVIVWGNGTHTTITTAQSNQVQSNVISIVRTDTAMAALKSNGSVVTWGTAARGGNLVHSNTGTSVSSQLQSGVVAVYPCSLGFAALKNNGSVIWWGDGPTNHATVSAQIQSGCVELARNSATGVNIRKADGSLVIIGDATSSYVAPTISAAIANYGLKRIFKDCNFVQYRDPVNEPNGGSLVLSGVPVQGSSIPIINTLISP